MPPSGVLEDSVSISFKEGSVSFSFLSMSVMIVVSIVVVTGDSVIFVVSEDTVETGIVVCSESEIGVVGSVGLVVNSMHQVRK